MADGRMAELSSSWIGRRKISSMRADQDGQPIAWSRVVFATSVAGCLSGLPSTVWAVGTRHSALEAARAAGTLLPGRRERPSLIAGCLVHGTMSASWTTFMAIVWRRRPLSPLEGAAVGLAIAAVDLAVVGRRYPAIKALPPIPQWMDHMAFGAVAAACLSPSTRTRAGQRTRR